MATDFNCKDLTKEQRKTCCPNEICLCDQEGEEYQEFVEDNYEDGLRDGD